MEAILLEPMFELPGLDGRRRGGDQQEVVEGRAQPLYIYAERRGDYAERRGERRLPALVRRGLAVGRQRTPRSRVAS